MKKQKKKFKIQMEVEFEIELDDRFYSDIELKQIFLMRHPGRSKIVTFKTKEL